jgi:hypothetical protein
MHRKRNIYKTNNFCPNCAFMDLIVITNIFKNISRKLLHTLKYRALLKCMSLKINNYAMVYQWFIKYFFYVALFLCNFYMLFFE